MNKNQTFGLDHHRYDENYHENDPFEFLSETLNEFEFVEK